MSRRSEFQLISDILSPLASGYDGALGLKDDAALLTPKPGEQYVTTVDAIVAGVHFVGDEPASRIGQKLLRVNLSDLAAMGALPVGYLLTLALPQDIGDDWLADFAAGLHLDQQAFGISLIGGDTVSTPGPLNLTLTAVGSVPEGGALLRSAALAGDDLYVSGTIGDAALGLKAVQDSLPGTPAGDDRAWLIERYQLPQPRLTLGQRLAGVAHAVMDVSDGLIADLGHMAVASEVSLKVELAALPLSKAARRLVDEVPELIETVLTGGDDYELIYSAPEDWRDGITALAGELKLPLTRIGRVEPGQGVYLFEKSGEIMNLSIPGWTHF
jgi:thiamine-monophosphate kinase